MCSLYKLKSNGWIQGPKGIQGTPGPQGPRGNDGENGGRGETGPPGPPITLNFAKYYTNIAQSIQMDDEIRFESPDSNNDSFITTSDGYIFTLEKGTYQISFRVLVGNNSQLAIKHNTAISGSSIVGVNAYTWCHGNCIIELEKDDQISLVNVGDNVFSAHITFLGLDKFSNIIFLKLI